MMSNLKENTMDYRAANMIEGIAHVVAVKGDRAWLEPEQTGSCGGCAASGMCGAKGIGTVANRLEARRFVILNEHGLINGERVVVGIREHALLQASLTAYALPLGSMFGCGILAQWFAGRDGVTLAAMVAGLVLGFGLMRLRAQHLQAKGVLSPQYLRRARANETCHTD
jgi:sigma-E factor negative regulatory protein RseC